MTYEQALEDREYLWRTYAEAVDMTGAYVDQDDLEKLLKRPTKQTARRCLERQIVYWCEAGPDDPMRDEAWKSDPEVRAIARRHGCEEDLDRLIAMFQ